jgi:hypothetical protein
VRSLNRTAGGARLASITAGVVARNTVNERRPPLPPAFRAELVEAFREEVARLSRLLNRDLSHWA